MPQESIVETAEPTFRRRLRAWWDGEALTEPRPGGADDTANDDDPTAKQTVEWTANRLDIVQMVFGEGFVGPGGERVAISLVQPLGLNESSNVLEIGSGLGGSTRAIASHSGAYVTGMEFDREYAAEARRQTIKRELEKKATVEIFNPTSLTLRENRYTGIVLREVLCRIENRRAFFLSLAKSVKSGGQVIARGIFLTDASQDTAYEQWLGSGQGEVYPPNVETVTAEIKSTGMDIRLVDDVSQSYHADVLRAWSEFLAVIEHSRPSVGAFELIEQEAEAWYRRLTLLQSGALTVHQIVGVRP